MRPKKTQLNPAIRHLPQKPDTWYLAVRSFPEILPNETLYFYTILAKNSNLVMDGGFLPQAPKPKKLLNVLERIMFSAHEEAPPPHRPMLIEFEQQEIWEALEPHLTKADIASNYQPQPTIVDEFIEQAVALINKPEDIHLDFLESPGMTPQLAGAFFSAAAALYQTDAWMVFDATRPIELTFYPPGASLYVFFMGQVEEEFGLLIFSSWKDALALHMLDGNSLDQFSEGEFFAIEFRPRQRIQLGVLTAIDEHKWEIAGPAAYPHPTFYTHNEFFIPDGEVVASQTLVLQAMALFTKEHLQSILHDDSLPIRAEYRLENNQDSTTVKITYPAPQIQAAMAARDYGLQEAGQAHVYSALKLVDQAWEADDPLTKVQMAQEALKIWPDCIEAFLVLGEEAESIEIALQFFQQGVQAAARALDHKIIEHYIGRIWDLQMVQAHLNARQGVLECLMGLEDYNKAKLAAEELLEINAMDDQGIRYSQLFVLTQLKNDKALRQLLDDYPEEMDCSWPYSRALLEFRQKGDSRKTRLLLQEALERNPYVPEYLTGKKLIPDEPPDYEDFGDENEAVYYAREYFNSWWLTKGAMDWLRRNISSAPKE